MCYVCLHKHARNECKSKYDCKICEKKHNYLVHIEKKVETKSLITTTVGTKAENSVKNKEGADTNKQNLNTLIAAAHDEDNLLATAMVRVLAKNGDKLLVRAVIDMGSQSAMITDHSRQALALKGEKMCAGVDGIEAMTTETEK